MDPRTKMTKEQMKQIGLVIKESGEGGFPNPEFSYLVIKNLGFGEFADRAKLYFKRTEYFKDKLAELKGKPKAKLAFARPMFSKDQENKYRKQQRTKRAATTSAELAKAVEEADGGKMISLSNRQVLENLTSAEFKALQADEEKMNRGEYKRGLREVRSTYGAGSKELDEYRRRELPAYYMVQDRKKAAVKATRQKRVGVRREQQKAETAAKKREKEEAKAAKEKAKVEKEKEKERRKLEREAKKREKEAKDREKERKKLERERKKREKEEKKAEKRTTKEVKRAEKSGDTVRARAIKVAAPRKGATDVPPPPPKGPRPVDIPAINELLSKVLGKK